MNSQLNCYCKRIEKDSKQKLREILLIKIEKKVGPKTKPKGTSRLVHTYHTNVH